MNEVEGSFLQIFCLHRCQQNLIYLHSEYKHALTAGDFTIFFLEGALRWQSRERKEKEIGHLGLKYKLYPDIICLYLAGIKFGN